MLLKMHNKSLDHKNGLAGVSLKRTPQSVAKAQKDRDKGAANKAAGTFHCVPCNTSSQTNGHYKRHSEGVEHRKKVEAYKKANPGVEVQEWTPIRKGPTTAKGRKQAEQRAADRASKKWYCTPCGYNAGTEANLKNHKKTPKHQKAMMRLEKEEAGDQQ
jgi:hypothetical protein